MMNTASKPAARLKTPTDLGSNAYKELAGALNAILADTFALYLKTKNFHWHVSGPHFHDYHLMFDTQADELFAATDAIAERVRKIGGNTLRSIGDISRQQTISDNDKAYVSPDDMLTELHEDTMTTVKAMRAAHKLCDDAEDIATASILENFIDQAEQRAWFLFETARKGAPSGH
jgi:starvation-inducible DNA-binding protein